MDEATLRSTIRAYIVSQFLDPGDEAELKDDTPLISSGVLDSLAVVKLAGFFATEFRVNLPVEVMRAEHLDTIDRMVATVTRAAGPAEE